MISKQSNNFDFNSKAQDSKQIQKGPQIGYSQMSFSGTSDQILQTNYKGPSAQISSSVQIEKATISQQQDRQNMTNLSQQSVPGAVSQKVSKNNSTHRQSKSSSFFVSDREKKQRLAEMQKHSKNVIQVETGRCDIGGNNNNLVPSQPQDMNSIINVELIDAKTTNSDFQGTNEPVETPAVGVVAAEVSLQKSNSSSFSPERDNHIFVKPDNNLQPSEVQKDGQKAQKLMHMVQEVDFDPSGLLFPDIQQNSESMSVSKIHIDQHNSSVTSSIAASPNLQLPKSSITPKNTTPIPASQTLQNGNLQPQPFVQVPPAETIQVIARLRPMISNEHGHPICVEAVPSESSATELNERGGGSRCMTQIVLRQGINQTAKDTSKLYSFEKVLGPESRQEQVFDEVNGSALCSAFLNGQNCTIFVYGPTSTGKTFTMQGDVEEIMGSGKDAVKSLNFQQNNQTNLQTHSSPNATQNQSMFGEQSTLLLEQQSNHNFTPKKTKVKNMNQKQQMASGGQGTITMMQGRQKQSTSPHKRENSSPDNQLRLNNGPKNLTKLTREFHQVTQMMESTEEKGIIQRVIDQLYSFYYKKRELMDNCSLKVSFLEIYNDQVTDLLENYEQQIPIGGISQVSKLIQASQQQQQEQLSVYTQGDSNFGDLEIGQSKNGAQNRVKAKTFYDGEQDTLSAILLGNGSTNGKIERRVSAQQQKTTNQQNISPQRLNDFNQSSRTPNGSAMSKTPRNAKDKKVYQVKENARKGVYVQNLSEIKVSKPEDAYHCLVSGLQKKRVSQTWRNTASSRSHTIFQIKMYMNQSDFSAFQQQTLLPQYRSTENEANEKLISKFSLVDLAGSERITDSEKNHERIEEAKFINKSLSALGNVVAALRVQAKNRGTFNNNQSNTNQETLSTNAAQMNQIQGQQMGISPNRSNLTPGKMGAGTNLPQILGGIYQQSATQSSRGSLTPLGFNTSSHNGSKLRQTAVIGGQNSNQNTPRKTNRASMYETSRVSIGGSPNPLQSLTSPQQYSSTNQGGSTSGYIPFRDSKLTHILKDSLGSNSFTHLIITLSPSFLCLQETISTLMFTKNAKAVKQNIVENVQFRSDMHQRKYQHQTLLNGNMMMNQSGYGGSSRRSQQAFARGTSASLLGRMASLDDFGGHFDEDEKMMREILAEIGGFENSNMSIKELFQVTLQQLKRFKEDHQDLSKQISEMKKALDKDLSKSQDIVQTITLAAVQQQSNSDRRVSEKFKQLESQIVENQEHFCQRARRHPTMLDKQTVQIQNQISDTGRLTQGNRLLMANGQKDGILGCISEEESKVSQSNTTFKSPEFLSFRGSLEGKRLSVFQQGSNVSNFTFKNQEKHQNNFQFMGKQSEITLGGEAGGTGGCVSETIQGQFMPEKQPSGSRESAFSFGKLLGGLFTAKQDLSKTQDKSSDREPKLLNFDAIKDTEPGEINDECTPCGCHIQNRLNQPLISPQNLLAMNRSLRYKTMMEIISNHIKAYIQKQIRQSMKYDSQFQSIYTNHRKRLNFSSQKATRDQNRLMQQKAPNLQRIKFADLLDSRPQRNSLDPIQNQYIHQDKRHFDRSVIDVLKIQKSESLNTFDRPNIVPPDDGEINRFSMYKSKSLAPSKRIDLEQDDCKKDKLIEDSNSDICSSDSNDPSVDREDKSSQKSGPNIYFKLQKQTGNNLHIIKSDQRKIKDPKQSDFGMNQARSNLQMHTDTFQKRKNQPNLTNSQSLTHLNVSGSVAASPQKQRPAQSSNYKLKQLMRGGIKGPPYQTQMKKKLSSSNRNGQQQIGTKNNNLTMDQSIELSQPLVEEVPEVSNVAFKKLRAQMGGVIESDFGVSLQNQDFSSSFKKDSLQSSQFRQSQSLLIDKTQLDQPIFNKNTNSLLLPHQNNKLISSIIHDRREERSDMEEVKVQQPKSKSVHAHHCKDSPQTSTMNQSSNVFAQAVSHISSQIQRLSNLALSPQTSAEITTQTSLSQAQKIKSQQHRQNLSPFKSSKMQNLTLNIKKETVQIQNISPQKRTFLKSNNDRQSQPLVLSSKPAKRFQRFGEQRPNKPTSNQIAKPMAGQVPHKEEEINPFEKVGNLTSQRIIDRI